MWIRRKLRGNDVYVRVDSAGKPIAGPDGRVDVAYKPSVGSKLYRASIKNLEPTGDPDDERPRKLELDTTRTEVDAAAATGPTAPTARISTEVDVRGGAVGAAGEVPIIVYTDGACSGNPGPMGIGVVILDGRERRELSEYLGEGTNNIAELTAILRALEVIPEVDRARPVVVHSDSAYALGLLGQGWKAKKNVDLVAELRRVAAGFPRLKLVKVLGHSGVSENERCDQLATAAAARRR